MKPPIHITEVNEESDDRQENDYLKDIESVLTNSLACKPLTFGTVIV